MLNAFLELSQTRGTSGFGPWPIQFSEILAYFDLRGISSEYDRAIFLEVILECDLSWRQWASARIKSKTKQ